MAVTAIHARFDRLSWYRLIVRIEQPATPGAILRMLVDVVLALRALWDEEFTHA
jgi:hypothetical protein